MPEMKSLTLNDKTYDCFVDSVARTLASATAVIKSASGESVTVTDASDVNLYGLRIFGKTTQDGVPTPDAPVDLVNVGDGGNITVDVTGENDAQSMTITTPNGLPGIPVSKGGNYTDANGQQWICDEIDLARGVYVKRIDSFTFPIAEMNNKESFPGWERAGIAKYYPGVNNYISTAGAAYMCNISNEPPYINTTSGNDVLIIPNYAGTTQSGWKTNYPNLVFKLIISIPTPIETPLSEEELAAYAELHTYRNNTTVSNNDGAHMRLEYVMDAKKYIDSLIGTGGGSSARLGSVTIKASAWVTEADGLHSQVVTIAGVTPYSKVDLLPSVEQLAIFHNKDVAFVTENEDGVVTVFAIGDKPTMDYTMQISITEVTV